MLCYEEDGEGDDGKVVKVCTEIKIDIKEAQEA